MRRVFKIIQHGLSLLSDSLRANQSGRTYYIKDIEPLSLPKNATEAMQKDQEKIALDMSRALEKTKP